MASAVRSVSCALSAPAETATTSSALPASFMRTASSTAISQKGFIAIFTFAVSTPVWSDLTRTFTLGSIVRLTATRTFMRFPAGRHTRGRRRAAADRPPRARPHTMSGPIGCQRHGTRGLRAPRADTPPPAWTLPTAGA